MLLIGCGSPAHKPTIVTQVVPCITENYPRFPGLPGAEECLEDTVCLPRPDFTNLLVWIDEISDWALTQETLCKREPNERLPAQ